MGLRSRREDRPHHSDQERALELAYHSRVQLSHLLGDNCFREAECGGRGRGGKGEGERERVKGREGGRKREGGEVREGAEKEPGKEINTYHHTLVVSLYCH